MPRLLGAAGGVSREIFKLLEGSSKAKGVCERVLAAMGEYGLEIRGIANATGHGDGHLCLDCSRCASSTDRHLIICSQKKDID